MKLFLTYSLHLFLICILIATGVVIGIYTATVNWINHLSSDYSVQTPCGIQPYIIAITFPILFALPLGKFNRKVVFEIIIFGLIGGILGGLLSPPFTQTTQQRVEDLFDLKFWSFPPIVASIGAGVMLLGYLIYKVFSKDKLMDKSRK